MLVNPIFSPINPLSEVNLTSDKESKKSNLDIDLLLNSTPTLVNSRKLREAVAETATSNKEQEIADSLLGAIDDHTIQLEAISNWTEGGLSAFKGALEMIAQNMLNNPPEDGEYGSYYEDLFQLVLMDVLANAEEYGFSQDQKFMQFLSWGLEYIGTGQHNSWVENLPVPDSTSSDKPGAVSGGNKKNSLVKIANYLWEVIFNKIQSEEINSNSLSARLMRIISKGDADDYNGQISSTLPENIYENLYTADVNGNVVNSEVGYYDPSSGGWITSSNNNISPMMRLVFLSNLLKNDPELSKNKLDIILFGSLDEINKLSQDLNGKNVYQFIIDYDNPEQDAKGDLIGDGNGWQNSSVNHQDDTRPSGVEISLDFHGELNEEWLENLSDNYPNRILGDEDIKEINRLGDSVKMIMQTLKYWFQIMRDERVAIARNI
ncbi:molecular chaperone [Vibrio cholerae]|uniref:molecular chaperone n=1 Tax=Vibrio cholerae TaxID=666 RepID=UPI00084A7E5A|nr:molecular chaperone [Vibrio cholerae]EHU0373923.1 molecular chaperone [Vibrio cholerae]EJL6946438.1 molecular chaperone [Vibrio cholerae]NOF78468.1 molecular chaperone [Vibrio cholerae]NOF81661.1 molecular chaperone [Vibrio cholerae]OEC28418.1 molecular chaperone [Vibrio cholerae]